MKELFYFSKSDLMIQVQFSQEANSLRYASHRRINDGEKELVEKYIADNVADSGKNPQLSTASLEYIGVDFKLINHLNQFNSTKALKNSNQGPHHESNPFTHLLRKDIDRSVKTLISTSMESYYFEKIGSTIIEAKGKVEAGARAEEIKEYAEMLSEMVKAYNEHACQKVELKNILPTELVQ